MTADQPQIQSQVGNNLKQVLAGLQELADQGIDLSEVVSAMQVQQEAKAIAERWKNPESKEKSIFQEKELIYEDENAFIYRRGDTKKRPYYIRINDPSARKPYIASLGTTNRHIAHTKAMEVYKDIKGKIVRGERIKSITSKELVELYLKDLSGKVTDVPKEGIVPETYRVKTYLLEWWLKYIDHLGYSDKPIDKINPDSTEYFCYWMLNQKKEDGSARSRDHINKVAIEITKAYKSIAVKLKFISPNQIPLIEKLKLRPVDGFKKDILTEEEWDHLRGFMEVWNSIEEIGGKWSKENCLRTIFSASINILMETGMRTKEYLGLKINEIEPMKTNVKDGCIIKIRGENSKTGRSRIIPAKCKRYINQIKEAYIELGRKHENNDFLIFNPSIEERTAYTRQALDHRFRQVMKESGLLDKTRKDGRTKISLYSSRHYFITRQMEKGVDINFLSRVVGSGVKNLEQVYGQIDVVRNAAKITDQQEDIEAYYSRMIASGFSEGDIANDLSKKKKGSVKN